MVGKVKELVEANPVLIPSEETKEEESKKAE